MPVSSSSDSTAQRLDAPASETLSVVPDPVPEPVAELETDGQASFPTALNLPLQVDVSLCEDAAAALVWLEGHLSQWPGIRPETAVQILTGTLRWQPEQLTELAGLVQRLSYRFHALQTLHPEARHLARKLGLPVVAPLSGTVITPAVSKGESAPIDMATLPTQVVHHNLRSGQSIISTGHLLVIGDVNVGAEVVAAGNITVWGELKGIAHAGSQGDTRAEVRSLRLDALQLRIAHAIARRPDHWIEHTQADRLTRGAAEGFYQPEVARIEQDEIRIFSHR